MMIYKMWTMKAWNPAVTAYLDYPAKGERYIGASLIHR